MESSQRVSWLSIILWTNRITKLTKPIPSHPLCWSLWTAETKISYGQVAMGLPLPKASTRTMWTPRWWRSCFLPLCHWVGVLEPSEWLGHRHVDGGAGDELMSWRQKQHGLRWWWEHFGLGPWSSFPSQSLGSFPWSQIDDSKLLTTCLGRDGICCHHWHSCSLMLRPWSISGSSSSRASPFGNSSGLDTIRTVKRSCSIGITWQYWQLPQQFPQPAETSVSLNLSQAAG